MPQSPVENIELNNGVTIPQIGFGVFQVPLEQTRDAVTNALEAGYRHIDTAAAYGNERAVGDAIRDFGIRRDEVFVTTKCWNSDQGYDAALRAFDASMSELGFEQLDLYLIHWPVPSLDKYIDTWKAFERLYADGRVRAIGVSNFHVPHLRRLLDESEVVPAVNQIELHPWLPQNELRDFCIAHSIAVQGWSPLARGGSYLNNVMLKGLADRYGRSVAQIILRWHMQRGSIVLPRTVHRDRAIENISLFDFELSDTDMQTIASLANGTRIGPDPDVFDRQ